MDDKERRRAQILATVREVAPRYQVRRGLLADLEPSDTKTAALRVQSASTHLAKPFSLCQLDPQDSDREWLLSWPGKVSPAYVSQSLENDFRDGACSPAERIGLILLLLATEIGRESAQAGEIWPVVMRQFPEKVRDILFTGIQPRPRLRSALEGACRRLDIRHAFGREGVQAYYLTIYLQFGFPKQSLNRLFLWMEQAQTRPRSVQILLEECEDFRLLWERLRGWTQGDVSPLDLQEIQHSTFLPKEWVAHIQLPAASQKLSYVTLTWKTPGKPRVQIDLAALFSDVEDGHYFLGVNQMGEEQLVSKDGTEFEPPTLNLDLQAAEINLYLTPLAAGAGVQESILIWDTQEDYQLIDPSRGRSTEKLPRGEFWVICRPDLKPVGAHSWFKLNAQWSVHRFLCPPSGPLILEGPDYRLEVAARQPNPLSSCELVVEEKTIEKLPCRLTATIRNTPVAVEKMTFKYRAEKLVVEVDTGLGFPEMELLVPLDLEQPEATVLARCACDGRTVSKTLRQPLQLRLATRFNGERWEHFQGVEEIEVAQAAYEPVRLFFPPEEYGLFEGENLSQRPQYRTQALTRLAGYGAPLMVRHGPFNSEKPDRVLARTVVFRGQCRSLDRRGDEFRLKLRRHHEADANSFLLWWDGGSRHFHQGLAETTGPRNEICGRLPDGFEEGPIAVALGYRSTRLGAVWTGCLQPPATGDWGRIARLLRWFHVPILSASWWDMWDDALRENLSQVLEAWMSEAALVLEGLTLRPQERPEFGEVVRRVLSGLGSIDGVIGRKWLSGYPLNHWVRTAPEFLKLLMTQFAKGVEMRAAASAYFQVNGSDDLSKMRWSAARTLRVGEGFIDHLAGSFAEGNEDSKLKVALTQETFQDYAVARWLYGHSRST